MVIGSSKVSIPLSFPGHPLRYLRLFCSRSGTDHYQGLVTLPCPSLVLESPLAICGLLTLINLILLESLSEKLSISDFLEVLSTDESAVEQVSRAVSNVHDLLIYLNSSDKTLSVWSCSFTLPHPTPRTNSLVPGFRFNFVSSFISFLKNDSFLLVSDLLSSFVV